MGVNVCSLACVGGSPRLCARVCLCLPEIPSCIPHSCEVTTGCHFYTILFSAHVFRKIIVFVLIHRIRFLFMVNISLYE